MIQITKTTTFVIANATTVVMVVMIENYVDERVGSGHWWWSDLSAIGTDYVLLIYDG